MVSIPFHGKSYILPDEIIGDDGSSYTVIQLLGKGGNGAVLECENAATGEIFAVKFLLHSKYFRKRRFEREIKIISKLNHEHIITYITHGKAPLTLQNSQSNGKKPCNSRSFEALFVVMRKADFNLREFLVKDVQPLSFETYYGQFVGLAKALEQLHCEAIHRDIKPDNILISGDIWQISDFGLCALIKETEEQLTRTDEAVGPRYWMSPEAISKAMGLREVINCCSDLFQLASVFWFVVTGRPPIGILTMEDWPGPASLGQLLLETLQHDPSRRPKSATEFLQKLEKVKFS
jgi:serine/threonine-protein kinase